MDFQPMVDWMRRMVDWGVPGNVVSVYKSGKRVFFHSEGFADLEKSVPMSGDELFNIYSCSKVTTVTAALQLYERGFFLLDDPVSAYLPAWKDIRVRDPDGSIRKPSRPLTVRHLFTMTGGLSYDFGTPAFERARQQTGGMMDTLKVIECLAEDPLTFDPGDRWQYSLCHDVLAALVEVLSGERFADYVKKHIWEPLDIKTASYHLRDEDASRMAEQYLDEGPGPNDPNLWENGSPPRIAARNVGKKNGYCLGENYDSGGAGIIVSTDDYARFAWALANRGTGLTGERILSPGSVDLLRENQLTLAQLADFNWPQLHGYGYGLGVRTVLSRAETGFTGPCGEFGWGGAAGATIISDPDAELALFYAEHLLNPHEEYYQPRLRNVAYTCL